MGEFNFMRISAKWLIAAFLLILSAIVTVALAQDWPFANAGGNYRVFEGDWVMLDSSGSSGMNGVEPTSYAWDMNNDGVFELPGSSVMFDASGRDGTANQIVRLEVCVTDAEEASACDTDVASIDILNAPPTVNAGADVTVLSGTTFSLQAIFDDPGASDTHTATVNYDNGMGFVAGSVFENAGDGIVSSPHTFYQPTMRNVQVCVADDDGGNACDTLKLQVNPLPVGLDIRPYYFPNTFNLDEADTLRLAILSSSTFDATTVNPNTVTLAGAPLSPSYSPYTEDVNGDGRLDLRMRVWKPDMVIEENAFQATVSGKTYAGVYFTGSDSIDLVPLRAPTSSTGAVYPVFTWGSVPGAVCYQIEIDNDHDFGSVDQISTIVDGTVYNAFPLLSGQYYWRVRVGGECIYVVQSGWSATRTVTVP